jgi:hypothetical protein
MDPEVKQALLALLVKVNALLDKMLVKIDVDN